MISPRWLQAPAGAVLVGLCLSACSVRSLDRTLVPPQDFQTLDHRSPYLKAHLVNGDLLVLGSWRVDDEGRSVSGEGSRQDPDRNTLATGFLSVPLDSVALFETNTTHTAPQVVGMAVLTGASLVVTAICIANPKACFGSCPTFYFQDATGTEPGLVAEGFSSSVAPSLEAADVDALPRVHPTGGRVRLTMRNEALETHVVRHADLLVVPRDGSAGAVVLSDGSFRRTGARIPPRTARGPEGDLRSLLAARDGVERWSRSDSTDLAARESLHLEFDAPRGGRLGLLLAGRQTLLSTYLFYQTLAYMGGGAGRWLAALERGSPDLRRRVSGLGEALGGIGVWIETAGDWVRVGEIQEQGPLAVDEIAVPLPPGLAERVRVRLDMTRGKHRLDQVALVPLGDPVVPRRIPPSEVLRDGRRDPEALGELIDPARVLVTLPGDCATLVYDVGGDPEDLAIFLESRGYYLEWIRESWLAEEDPSAVAEILLSPRRALRRMAPAFKATEAEMEAVFWSSKYARP